MSSSRVEVTKIHSIQPHPNADRLELARVFEYPVVIEKGKYDEGSLVGYVPPDSLVPVHVPQFSFLRDKAKHVTENGHLAHRVRAVKLRGCVSQGLVVDAEGYADGDDITERLGVEHWNPPDPANRNIAKNIDSAPPPPVPAPVYDVESYRRHLHPFEEAIRAAGVELVRATEKIHGSNARYTVCGDELYVGTRRRWVTGESAWAEALETEPKAKEFLYDNPGVVLYGEIFGYRVQGPKFSYGTDLGLVIFDIMKDGRWVDDKDKVGIDLPWVPTLFYGEYKHLAGFIEDRLLEGQSEFAHRRGVYDHIMEGMVVLPNTECWSPKIGRAQLKLCSERYYLKG